MTSTIREKAMRVFSVWIICLLAAGGCASRTAAPPVEAARADAATQEEVRFDELWDYDDPAKTETVFNALLPDFPADKLPLEHAELLTQIARTQSLQQKFKEAHALLDEAETLIGGKDSVALVRLWLERGRTHNSAGEKDAARLFFLKAYRLALALDVRFHAIDAAHMMAIVETPDLALEWNLVALHMAESSASPPSRRWQGSLLNNLGWTYFDKQQYADALALFEKALVFREEQGKPEPVRVARWSVARTLRALGRVPEALAMQKQLAEELERLHETDGFVFEELAECHAALGDAKQARDYAARAYGELGKLAWFVQAEPERLERLKALMGEPQNSKHE
ncbi:MAG: tetratricopeptide repeat protein [Myxococcales bacterium]|nr:MAG: tetratricopeptide repeat protein [Myxococcales bacterium]